MEKIPLTIGNDRAARSRPLKTGASFTLTIPPPPAPHVVPGATDERLVHCRFEDGLDLTGEDTAWMRVDCAGLDGKTVRLVLEREEDGGWTEVGSAVSTVKAGEAHAGLSIEESGRTSR